MYELLFRVDSAAPPASDSLVADHPFAAADIFKTPVQLTFLRPVSASHLAVNPPSFSQLCTKLRSSLKRNFEELVMAKCQ
jgi:hypothetical protein